MYISVILSDALNTAWRAASPAATAALRLALAGQGSLLPVHPNTSEPELLRYFYVEISDPATAMSARERLAATPGVDAAYIKPDAALP